MRTNMDHSGKRTRPCAPLAMLVCAALFIDGCAHNPTPPPSRPAQVSAGNYGNPATSPAALAAASRVQQDARVQQIQGSATMTPQQKEAAIQSLQMQSGQQALPNAPAAPQ